MNSMRGDKYQLYTLDKSAINVVETQAWTKIKLSILELIEPISLKNLLIKILVS